MRLAKAETVFSGPVNGRYVATFDASKEETDELRRALAVVQRWEKTAMAAVKQKKNADFTMAGFAVKTDKVIVTIDNGACG